MSFTIAEPPSPPSRAIALLEHQPADFGLVAIQVGRSPREHELAAAARAALDAD